MILRFITISALVSSALFAQGFGQYGGRRGYNAAGATTAGSGATHTPPTPAQLAAAELTRIARFLKLDSADTSKLTANTTLVGYLETEATALQTDAATLKTAYSTLATDIGTSNTKDAAAQESTIETTASGSLQARVTAAGQVVAELPNAGLSVTLTSAQLTSVSRLLISGGYF